MLLGQDGEVSGTASESLHSPKVCKSLLSLEKKISRKLGCWVQHFIWIQLILWPVVTFLIALKGTGKQPQSYRQMLKILVLG